MKKSKFTEQHCCVSEHSGLDALQLQRLENSKHSETGPFFLALRPISFEWQFPIPDEPTTTESERQSARPCWASRHS